MDLSTLFRVKKVVFSLEVFPPKKDNPVHVIYNTLLGLRGLPADFISVTYGAGGSAVQQSKTCEIASLIRSNYHIEPVSHLTCVNARKDKIIETLNTLKENGVQNILALRGDLPAGEENRSDFAHASDLAAFIKSYDASFNLVGACYPECHYESQSLEADIENLKYKIDSGVTHLITQLFLTTSVSMNL